MMIKENNLTFFTIVAKNYFAYARTLMDSVALAHPDARCIVFLSDSDDSNEISANINFEVVEAKSLSLPDFEHFTFRYDVMEFSTAIKPFAFKYIFNNLESDAVIYLDPDIYVLNPLVKVIDLIEKGSSAVVTPHLTSPLLDGKSPDERSMLQVGVYNLGFIAVANNQSGNDFVNWWAERLTYYALSDLPSGLFTDQKWVDLAPCLFDGFSILRDTGYNAAYWNLMHREITVEDGEYYSNSSLLAFFHFSGVVINKPNIFSKHQDRYTREDLSDAMRTLYNSYIELLNKNKHAEYNQLSYAYGTLNNGDKIEPWMREVFRQTFDQENINPYELTISDFKRERQSDLMFLWKTLHQVYKRHSAVNKAASLLPPKVKFYLRGKLFNTKKKQ